MASDYNSVVLDNYDYSANSGWSTKGTRAAGLLAILLATYDMSLQDVAAWAAANKIPDWEFTVDQSDAQLIGTTGTLYFLDEYPLPGNWQALWNSWAGGIEISQLPAEPATASQSTSSPIVPASYPASSPTQTSSMGNIPWIWILAGGAALLLLMGKKGKSR
jgi:hypothetical protein